MSFTWKSLGLFFCFQLSAFAFDHTHSEFDSFLTDYVKVHEFHSEFDYGSALKDKNKLKKYTDALSSVKQSDFDSWNEKQKLSFLINAYNAFTIQLILDNYPVDSIKDSKISFFSPFKKSFFKLFNKERSLGEVEHEMIRSWFKEARIHFAIVCASIGCPAIQNKAFSESNLESMLEKGANTFMSDKTRNRYSKKDQELQISKIFDWFEDDFKRDFGSVKAFVIKYMPLSDEEKQAVLSSSTDVDYTDYNWKLNQVKK
ncbi:MAG: DUF547 domain-containing protein [Bdellovibrionota bacterium]|nr:DUF547 domain-containing protein [Bdellovibrionota bacterium]